MLTLRQRIRFMHRAWRYRRRTERDEIAVVRSVVRPGDLVLDIGAHKGAFTYWMAKAAGSEGKVLAFEPIPHLAAYLRDASEWMANYDIEIHECALSDANGSDQLFFPGRHLGSASLEKTTTVFQSPIGVKKQKLDDLLSKRRLPKPVSLIKCDVENHELAVLRGASQLLERDKPVLLFESGNLDDGRELCQPTFEFLIAAGYEGFFLDHGRLIGLADFDPVRHEVEIGANQNFVFTPRHAVIWEATRRPFRMSRTIPSQVAA